MKRILTLTISLLTLAVVSGQPQKNDWMVGANIASFNAVVQKGISYIGSGVALSPQAGYFLNDNLVLGVGVHYNYANDGMFSENYDFGAALFSRYYLKLKIKSSLFIDADAGFSKMTISKTPYLYYPRENQNYNLGLGIGYTYFISSYVGLEIVLKAEHIKYSQAINISPYKPINTILVPYLGWGFQIYLPSGKPKIKLK